MADKEKKKREELLSGASQPLELGGRVFEAYPLSDQDLDSLTNWIRYKLQKDAEAQAEFAGSISEAEEIREKAFRYSQRLRWWDNIGINLILNDPAGLTHVVYLMLKKEYKKPFFGHKFGGSSSLTKEHLENRSKVQKVFLDQNVISDEEEDPKENKDSSKNE